MYPEKKEIVLFGVDPKPLKPFVPELKIRMNKGKAFDVTKVSSSRDVYEILKRVYGRNPIQEHFVMLLFNKTNKLTGYYKHTIGTMSATLVDIPMIAGLATKALAQGVAVSHNHPSENPNPSDQDREMTKQIFQALKTIRINLLDHIIYTNEGYYSFADEGALNGLNNTTMITVENIMTAYPGIDQSILPKALKKEEFEFIRENIDLYNDDETIKKYMNTFVEKLNEVLHKPVPEKSTKERKPKSPKSPVDSGKSIRDEKTKPVEKVMLEILFIKRFIGLDGKTKTRAQIVTFLSALQKAMIEKRIRKTSPYANEILNIQNQLIKCWNEMGSSDTIQVNINKKTMETYTEIFHSEKAMLSVLYIKQYIGLHGKQGVKEKAKALAERIHKALKSGKIEAIDPYFGEITEIQQMLKSYLGNKIKVPAIRTSTLNGIMSWIARRQQKKKVAKYLQKIYETERGLRGAEELSSDHSIIKPDDIISSTELARMNFKTIGFTGKWLDLVGDPSERFTAMLYGGPGCGKSTLAIEFASYLANDHDRKVLYIANEEKVSKTLQDKLKLVNGNHPNLNFVGVLRKDKFNEFDCIFIDSINTLSVSPVDLEEIAASHPALSIIYICQTTKEGKYRGSREFEHFADVVVKVENGVARSEKNRFGGRGEFRIW